MNTQLLTNICPLILCLGAANHAPWPLLIFLASLLPLLFNTWRVRGGGGFAWRGATAAVAPGPAGWPLLGCIPVVMSPLAHRRLAELAAAHGAPRLMALSLGATRVVISSHPDTAREILCGSAFADRPPKKSASLLMFERAIGFAPSGVYWSHLRRVAAANMFCPRRIAAQEPLRQSVAGDLVRRVGEEMETRGVVELRGLLQRGSLESMVGSLFGGCLGREREGELAEMVKEGYELIGTFNWEDHFPMGGLLDFHGVGKRCKSLAEKVRRLVREVMEERRRDGLHNMGEDFLSVLLTLPEEESLCDSDVIAVLWEMMFRGTDVVAILLEWIMARVVLHPTVQAKAQDEIDACLAGAHRPVRDSDIPRLPYLQAVVKEVLRLHPPGPLLSWARLAVHDVHVGKSFVPAGTTAMVNMWAITHDASIWKDPWTFLPERFLEEEVSVTGSDLRLAPFGCGRRACPGRALGLATVHLWLARLLQHYAWLPGGPVVLAERLRLSMEMKNPPACRAVLRAPLGCDR